MPWSREAELVLEVEALTLNELVDIAVKRLVIVDVKLDASELLCKATTCELVRPLVIWSVVKVFTVVASMYWNAESDIELIYDAGKADKSLDVIPAENFKCDFRRFKNFRFVES